MLAGWLLASAASAAVFAPDDGRTYRLVSTLTRSDGETTLHFSAERTIVFRREPGGWAATVTLRSVTSDAPAPMRARYEASVRRTEHAPLVAHLDPRGAVTAIDDEDARWADYQRMMAGLPASAPGSKASAAELARMLKSSLSGMTPQARRALLAGSLTEVIGSGDASLAPSADRRITIPSVRGDGRPIAVPGHQRVSRDASGLFVHTEADDEEAIGGGVTRVHLTFDRRVDSAAGLVLERRETRETVVETGSGSRRSRQESYQQLTPVS